jgi:hypothetical protein
MSDEKEYQEQIEAGKTFVKETLTQLATDLKKADINEFTFEVTDKDFDNEQESIFDPKGRKVVVKLNKDDLADCSTTPSVKSKLKNQVETAVRTYYKGK